MVRFVVDSTLGKLARMLRAAGFDTVYFPDRNRLLLPEISRGEDRTLLTRDPELAGEVKSLLIVGENVRDQLIQVFFQFGIPSGENFFTRCVVCNDVLEEVSSDLVRERVPPYVFESQKKFLRCPRCSRIYWRGSHYERMKANLENIITIVKESVT